MPRHLSPQLHDAWTLPQPQDGIPVSPVDDAIREAKLAIDVAAGGCNCYHSCDCYEAAMASILRSLVETVQRSQWREMDSAVGDTAQIIKDSITPWGGTGLHEVAMPEIRQALAMLARALDSAARRDERRKAQEAVVRMAAELKAHMHGCKCHGLDYERHCSKLAGYHDVLVEVFGMSWPDAQLAGDPGHWSTPPVVVEGEPL